MQEGANWSNLSKHSDKIASLQSTKQRTSSWILLGVINDHVPYRPVSKFKQKALHSHTTNCTVHLQDGLAGVASVCGAVRCESKFGAEMCYTLVYGTACRQDGPVGVTRLDLVMITQHTRANVLWSGRN